jgi:hypothetical protein
MTGDRLNWWGSERCKDEIDSEEEKIACLLRILIGARLKIKENTFFFTPKTHEIHSQKINIKK